MSRWSTGLKFVEGVVGQWNLAEGELPQPLRGVSGWSWRRADQSSPLSGLSIATSRSNAG